MEEERVSFLEGGVWRAWRTADLYRSDLVGQRVRVRGSIDVPSSTLASPGGGDTVATLLGHSRCGSGLRGEPWCMRSVDTPIMLLCRDGSHGLDLSFVTHIFLLGHVDDPAHMQQIVSRADRMGAQADRDGRGCVVETLVLWPDEELAAKAKSAARRRQKRQR